jgi:hypothetical protein
VGKTLERRLENVLARFGNIIVGNFSHKTTER